MIAFAKNGYPLVSGSGADGYVSSDPATGITVKNSGGPLQFVRGQTQEERDNDSIVTSDDAANDKKTSVENLTKIVVRLDSDIYAHVGGDYAAYAQQELRFTGAVAASGGVSLTVGELETKQRYMAAGEYTIDGVSGTYRGLRLAALLNDASFGASALMSGITVKNEAGISYTLTVAELDGWKHVSGSFAQYADYTIEISGQNLVNNKIYTVAEIEAMDNIITSDAYQMGGTYYIQGVELYKLLGIMGFTGELETSDFTAYAKDGYATQFKGSDLKNGVNGKPILIAFGQGASADNGLPLVPETTSPGYDPNIGNAFGPLRLVVNDNSGWCVKYLSKIVVGAASVNPVDHEFESRLAGNELPNAGVRTIAAGTGGVWAGTYGGGLVFLPDGGGEAVVYNTAGTPALLTDFASAAAQDESGGVWFSQNASYTTPGENRGVGYMKGGAVTWYRASDNPAAIAHDYVQAIEIDDGGNVWFGSFGGVTKYDGEIRDTLAALDSGGADVTQKTLSVDARTQQPSDKTIYTLAADALEVLINDGTAGIELHMNQGTPMLDAELLGFLEDVGTGGLTIEIARGDLNGAPCAADITVRRGDTVISELGGFLLKAEFGYDAPDTHSQPGIVVYRAGEDGLKTIVKLAAYSAGSVKMALPHLSRYEVSYNPVIFADVMIHWGRSGIEFLAARDIVKGYQDGLFSPDGRVTRAEFIKMLAETAGIAESENPINAGFSDVLSGAWYAGYAARVIAALIEAVVS